MPFFASWSASVERKSQEKSTVPPELRRKADKIRQERA
jgi:hypothetical protein